MDQAHLMRDYRRLLERKFTEASEHEFSGPEHGDRGPALAVWTARVAQPWFDAIAALAAEDGLAVGTYQGFDEYRSGSSPCAFPRPTSPDPNGSDRMLLADDLRAVEAALVRRGWQS